MRRMMSTSKPSWFTAVYFWALRTLKVASTLRSTPSMELSTRLKAVANAMRRRTSQSKSMSRVATASLSKATPAADS